ncbi:hypothetical protein Ancab_023384 [Ancistrocladus abbreviatus]
MLAKYDPSLFKPIKDQKKKIILEATIKVALEVEANEAFLVTGVAASPVLKEPSILGPSYMPQLSLLLDVKMLKLLGLEVKYSSLSPLDVETIRTRSEAFRRKAF